MTSQSIIRVQNGNPMLFASQFSTTATLTRGQLPYMHTSMLRTSMRPVSSSTPYAANHYATPGTLYPKCKERSGEKSRSGEKKKPHTQYYAEESYLDHLLHSDRPLLDSIAALNRTLVHGSFSASGMGYMSKFAIVPPLKMQAE